MLSGCRGRYLFWLGGMVLVWAHMAVGEDWPQWRGTNRDGVWRESGVVQAFSGEQIEVKWRTAIASGYCGPTVAAGKVYVMDYVRRPDEAERVHCFDAMTGKEVWSYSYPCRYQKIGYPAGPRASVIIDEGRAYALGTMGHLHCFDAARGAVIWKKDLDSEYHIKMPSWGIAVSPLMVGELVIVPIGGRDNASMVAFDKKSGAEKWRGLNDRAQYSAPILTRQGESDVVICWTGDRLVGLDPRSGKVYWDEPFTPSRMPIGIATPVRYKDYVLVSSFYDGSLVMKLDPDRPAARKLWRRKGPNERNTDSLHCCISTPVILDDYIYGVDSYGQFRCLELLTGDRGWESQAPVPEARWSNIHMVRNGNNIWMFNERGELIISKLSPRGYEEISRAKLITPTQGQLDQRGGVCWSHPAYANKHIYIRNDEELVCADLSTTE